MFFSTRPLWKEINIGQRQVNDLYHEYLGTENRDITSRKEAIKFLAQITSRIQDEMTIDLKRNNPEGSIKDLYKILDEVYHFYRRQKEARSKMREAGVDRGDTFEVFSENRNMARNIIDAVNLWIENSLLFQENLEKEYDKKSFNLNKELCIKMYIYGAASQALSLISMSQKFDSKELFTGVKIRPDEDYAIEPIRYHPVIHFNTALTGNQNILAEDTELKNADDSIIGEGFYSTYKIKFIYSLRLLSAFKEDMLLGGKCAMTVIDKKDFIDTLQEYSPQPIDIDDFFELFVLDKEKIKSQIKGDDGIIWIMNANQYRHEIRPFLCLENDRIFISYCALQQAQELWSSILLNGGMCYSNKKDDLTRAIERRNEELSDKLVEILREKLNSHFKADFDKIDVRYDRIFGSKDIDYGDYDLIFYSDEVKELFLIEAKFFSDSLNNSGTISDYEKMFKAHGYYEHCRGRYDLVMAEPEKMKQFIGATDRIKAHFLFVSSKPLEIEFQDEDGVVCFPCLSIFDDYIKGKLLPEVGDDPVRPTHEL